MPNIKAIETIHNGHKFRSRLEARWAVFFESLCVDYEYEPEGFELPASGKRYLPDFRIKCYGTRGSYFSKPFDLWIEVKGKMTEYDANRLREFALIGDMPLLIVSKIPDRGHSWDSHALEAYERMDGQDIYPFNYLLIDGDYFGAYPAAHEGKFYLWGDDSNYVNKEDVASVEQAYDTARMRRF